MPIPATEMSWISEVKENLRQENLSGFVEREARLLGQVTESEDILWVIPTARL